MNGHLTRRGLAGVALGAGFARSVQPVSAGTIITPDDGLDTDDVTIRVGGDAIPAYRARPQGGQGEAVIIVTQEIFGVHEHIRDLCRRLARAGHYAIAPALYVRQGDPETAPNIKALVETIVAKVPDAQVFGDLDATAAFAADEGADGAKLGITGFCWGGRIVWLYAAHNPNLKAGVAWYGKLVGKSDPLHPRQPVDVAGELKAPVLGLYGEKDGGISLESVAAMRAALGPDSKSSIIVYPGAPHGFNADYRESYVEADARDGWAKMLAFFTANGVA